MAYHLCLGCLDVFTDEDGRECECSASAATLTPIQALEMTERKWIGASLERIADALEELCTFKEEEALAAREARERTASGGAH